MHKKNIVSDKKVVKATDGVKTLREKTDEIIKLNDDLGMHDPSTTAKIQAMENAIIDNEDVALTESPDLVERRRHRDAPKSVVDVKITSDQKARNEALSEKMNVEKAKDVKEDEGDVTRPESQPL